MRTGNWSPWNNVVIFIRGIVIDTLWLACHCKLRYKGTLLFCSAWLQYKSAYKLPLATWKSSDVYTKGKNVKFDKHIACKILRLVRCHIKNIIMWIVIPAGTRQFAILLGYYMYMWRRELECYVRPLTCTILFIYVNTWNINELGVWQQIMMTLWWNAERYDHIVLNGMPSTVATLLNFLPEPCEC